MLNTVLQTKEKAAQLRKNWNLRENLLHATRDVDADMC
jgi:hypothetical protein